MTNLLLRLLDLLLASLLLIVLALPMAAIAILIRASDGGPALFRQQRVGKGTQVFEIFKFRTMVVDREGTGSGVVVDPDENVSAANARFRRTIPGDPRITHIGRFLRPSHLDELPQLLNILRGDMSFVGVRPDTPVQVTDYDEPYWQERHRFAPGLTGPAQLQVCDNLSTRSTLERQWLEGRSLWLYLRVLLRTLGKVIRRNSL